MAEKEGGEVGMIDQISTAKAVSVVRQPAVKEVSQSVTSPGSTPFQKILEGIERGWGEANHRLDTILPKLTGETKNLMDAQRLVQSLHFQTELLTRCADAFSSTVRRVQQVGNG